ncbi:GNAT family N-acetyltransferase [Treponema sp.]|uniref:GNAT family N-acetyltransferase n=1 Tax=Treponema sp. TaxID=166 RepID=UPI003F0154E7
MSNIIFEINNEKLFRQAEIFIAPHEKKCCQLMQSLSRKSADLYIIRNKKTEGVFSLGQGGTLTGFFPRLSKKSEEELGKFLGGKKILCVSADRQTAEKARKIILKKKNISPEKSREMFFMEYRAEKNPPVRLKAEECSAQDAEELFPLQVSYIKEEVLPEWKKINLPLERMNFERILKTQRVFAVKIGGTFCAKAQTNSASGSTVQIGGVFTKPEFRSKGIASSLVKKMAQEFQQEGKTAVLFVDKKNAPAIRAYRKAGFKIFGKYKILYYRPEIRFSST